MRRAVRNIVFSLVETVADSTRAVASISININSTLDFTNVQKVVVHFELTDGSKMAVDNVAVVSVTNCFLSEMTTLDVKFSTEAMHGSTALEEGSKLQCNVYEQFNGSGYDRLNRALDRAREIIATPLPVHIAVRVMLGVSTAQQANCHKGSLINIGIALTSGNGRFFYGSSATL